MSERCLLEFAMSSHRRDYQYAPHLRSEMNLFTRDEYADRQNLVKRSPVKFSGDSEYHDEYTTKTIDRNDNESHLDYTSSNWSWAPDNVSSNSFPFQSTSR